jgi:hypothetical protein
MTATESIILQDQAGKAEAQKYYISGVALAQPPQSQGRICIWTSVVTPTVT